MSWKIPLPKIPSLNLDLQSKYSFFVILAVSLGLLLYLSLIGLAGPFGEIVNEFFREILGRLSFVPTFVSFVIAVMLVRIQRRQYLVEELNTKLLLGIILMLFAICGFLSLISPPTADFQYWGTLFEEPSKNKFGGGVVGYILFPAILGFFGNYGGLVLLTAIWVYGFFLFSQKTPYEFVNILKRLPKEPKLAWNLVPDIFEFWRNQTNVPEQILQKTEIPIIIPPYGGDTAASTPQEAAKKTIREAKTKNTIPAMDNKEALLKMAGKNFIWRLPPFSLIQESTIKSDSGNVEENKKIIQQTLSSFNVEVEMKDVVTGPTVSQYQLKPTTGVKLSIIDTLSSNIALELAAQTIRIESPIAGKSLVGIEIPNKVKSTVRLRNILQTNDFVDFKGDLPVAVGLDIAGHNLIYSLAKMPHLLVAGSTGSGKSVWINSMLLSLLYKYSPKDLQLILVDMKRVELKLYDGIPHLLTPVITDAEKAINSLKWAVLEMENRYKLLEKFGKRSIIEYNELAKNAGMPEEAPIVPYTVFVIDELGDLMMLAKNEVEPMIVRLTQMSRAVGIHIVLGTQRPDTQVVTGLIKANIPTRIAFAVASQIDSRVILDQAGAEKLLGQGDGMFMSPSTMKAVRFQGAYVDEKEVKDCIEFIKSQVGENIFLNNYDETVTQPPRTKLNIPGMKPLDSDGFEEGLIDDVYEKAKQTIFHKGMASTSLLQTALGIGYPRARKFIQMMEDEGIVGPPNGSKPRDVYPPDEFLENQF
jgi:DNA segregation ATPase FtsK/SpoIIIE, S-DNA-T family